MLKAFHLLLATLLLGIQIFNYLLVSLTKNQSVAQVTLRTACKIDTAIVALMIVVFISGTLIVPIYHWNYQTPWISAAYLFLTITTLLWVTNIYLKKRWINGKKHIKLFHICNIFIIVLLLIIIKDAVTKKTWLI